MSKTLNVKSIIQRSLAFIFSIAIIFVGVVVAIAFSDFGQQPQGEYSNRIKSSPEWHGEHFENLHPMWTNAKDALLGSILHSNPDAKPNGFSLPTTSAPFVSAPVTGLRITWMGHSSLVVEIDGVNVLIDPVWSDRVSPISWIGPKRWYGPTLALENLPPIDVVLISHDHYDHLDHDTIVKMKNWKAHFVVPLGIGAHLRYWGIPEDRITELDWWQSTKIKQLDIVSTPSRHASGRLSPDSDKTLWSGFALRGDQNRVYYSGDTGFFPEFKEIGEKLGPFDVTMIEVGQYDADWPDWHLGPEQAVQAHRLVKGNMLLPVHWGLFQLAQHGWTEPVERVLAAASCYDINILTPKPGQSFEPRQHPTLKPWWPKTPWQNAEEKPIVATLNGNVSERISPPNCADASIN